MERQNDECVYLHKCLWPHEGEYDILKSRGGTDDAD